MRLVVLAVGSPGSPLAEPIRAYRERASRYFDLETVEVPAAPGSLSREEAVTREAGALRRRLPAELESFGLTREGKGLSSSGLARYLGEVRSYGLPGAVFVLGGPHGLAADLLEETDRRLSLSPMTLPHEMARLVLLEQLYRAGTILRGEPYHRGGER